MYNIIWLTLKHLLLDILLPTTNTFCNLSLAISALVTNHYRVSFLIFTPVILNLFFIICVWKKNDNLDTKKEKRFTWVFVLLSFWPQYQVLKLLKSIILKNDSENEWRSKKESIRSRLSYIQPSIEAIPQYFISLCIITYVYRGTDVFLQFGQNGNKELCDMFGDTVLGTKTISFFAFSLFISLINGIKSLADYLQNGPMRISSESRRWNGIIYSAKLIYIILAFLNKICIANLCINVFYMIQVTVQCNYEYTYWDTDELCVKEFETTLGTSILLLIIVFALLIPTLNTIVPMSIYLGPQKTILLLMRNPPLLTLHLITDFAYGPSSGSGLCCWFACSSKEEYQIVIKKKRSWVIMFYTTCILFPFFLVGVLLAWAVELPNLLSWLIPLYIVYVASFIIILYGGDDYGEINLQVSKTREKDNSGNMQHNRL